MGGDTGTERQLARSRVAIGYAVAKRQACAPWLVSTSRALPPDIRCISRGCNRGMTAVSAGNHRRKQRPTREGIILYLLKNGIKITTKAFFERLERENHFLKEKKEKIIF